MFLRLFANETSQSRRRRTQRNRDFRPSVERLEDRRVPANLFLVNITGDQADPTPNDGIQDDVDPNTPGNQYSLRGAIQTANSKGNAADGPDVISFSINNSPVIILPGTQLPAITDSVIIDGTAPQDKPNQRIEIQGSNAIPVGLTLNAGKSTIKSLVINQFTDSGIRIQGPGNNIIQNNFIGTDPSGLLARKNTVGIKILDSSGNLIGGDVPGTGNLISGNELGVQISLLSALVPVSNNRLQRNIIGADINGAGALPNGGGVLITNSVSNTFGNTKNVIGGSRTLAEVGNIISGNTDFGIRITDNLTNENVVQSNLIGTAAGGTQPLPNGNGVEILSGASKNQIGGFRGVEENVISANRVNGIRISGLVLNPTENVVQGNFIGTDATGLVALPNGTAKGAETHGIAILDASENIIGGTIGALGNTISGNVGHGILIAKTGKLGEPNNNRVQGNYIGTDIVGASGLANGGSGIAIFNSRGTQVGSSAPAPGQAPGNVISGNSLDGVTIWTDASLLGRENRVQGNVIGTDVTGTNVIANTLNGVYLASSKNTVGGFLTGERNLISGNGLNGVRVESLLEVDIIFENRIQGNLIGTDITGTLARGNSANGYYATSGTGINALRDNVISANGTATENGIYFLVSGSNQVHGNKIGTDITGKAIVDSFGKSLGNRGDGIVIQASGFNVIGSPQLADGNTIGGNGAAGIRIWSDDNTIQNNSIGEAGDKASKIPNRDGMIIDGGKRNKLIDNRVAFNLANGVVVVAGADNVLDRNWIDANTGHGVVVASGTGTKITQNSIYNNSLLGINLVGGVENPATFVTDNDSKDADTGPNNLQNYPIITSAYRSGGSTFIYGTLNSTPYSAFDVEIFVSTTGDPSGYGEGQQYLATAIVPTDEFGNGAFVTATIGEFSGYATATATGVDGTSEFSMWVPIVDMQPQFFDGPETTPETDAGQITDADLQPLIAEAAARWTAAGFDVQRLAGVEFIIADLPGNTLGLT